MAKILNWRLLKAHIWCLKKAVAVSSCRFFFFSFLHFFCLMCPKRLQLQIQNAVILPHAQPKSNYTTQEMFSVYQHWGDTFKKVRLKKNIWRLDEYIQLEIEVDWSSVSVHVTVQNQGFWLWKKAESQQCELTQHVCLMQLVICMSS